MFSRIQARHFRSLKSVDQVLRGVQALVGPNASGKSTFLDVIGLLSDLMRERGDVVKVIHSRSGSFDKLVWQGEPASRSFQLAVEAVIPNPVRARMDEQLRGYTGVRYELEVGLDQLSNELGFNHETLWLKASGHEREQEPRELFPAVLLDSASIMSRSRKGTKMALRKVPGGNDNYYPEGAATYTPSFKLGRGKSALANLPADERSFPVSTWFRSLLETGVQRVVLNSQAIRLPSPPGLGLRFQTDGSNLPWVIASLRHDRSRFDAWVAHVRTALEDIADIDTVEREEDRHRHLVVRYRNGAEVPSWLVSDGTLRLLALTLPAYLPDVDDVYLIEEPENGIHPRAIETVIQSLSSIYGGQVLLATHSPVALNLLEADQVLCFAKDESGATDVVPGHLHPALVDWRQGQPDLGVLFAAGILS
ncbi:MAG: AAA family ATPase [Rubrivivax sp.]|nr:AAA family ATPase [Rubrivivax sp.]